MRPPDGRPVTLAIDVGGSGIKAALIGPQYQLVGKPLRVETPDDLTPRRLLDVLVALAVDPGDYDRVSVGINGLVHRGRIFAIPVTSNPDFRGFDLAESLCNRLGRPVRILNDAQMHGLGFVRGRGVEVVLTLGTGLGTALFIDGTLGPQLQLLPAAGREGRKGGDYGDRAIEELGRKKWRRRVGRLIELLRQLTNFHHLYIGGGNAEVLKLDLPPDVTIGDNSAALGGAVRMWEWDLEPVRASRRATPRA
ncbi:MAG TPA: ROK family protein [Vicinamibacteria bacterium]|nr:ROK family protein [Vicinamibacteria bacterium]